MYVVFQCSDRVDDAGHPHIPSHPPTPFSTACTPPSLQTPFLPGSIDYLEFVDVFHKQRSGMDRLLEQICRVFYKYQDSLGRVFHYMDIDGDGVLTPDEFKEGLSTFNAMVSEPLTDHVIQSVVQHIDRNKDGQISYQVSRHPCPGLVLVVAYRW